MTKWFRKALIAVVLVFSMVLPILTPVVSAAGEGSASGLKDYHSMTMEQIFALDEDLTWVVTGDSITHNTSFTQGMNSYTEWFEQYLYTTGRGDDVVINTAWGGADIRDFLYPEDTPGFNGITADGGMGLEQFITRHNPDIITIKLGMNNRGMSDADFAKYYNKMLDSIYAEGEKNGKIPKIIIITPTPISNENMHNQDETDKDSVWRFQKNLKRIAEERDLLFVDLQTAFCMKAEEMGADEYRAMFFSDGSDGGIHPNAPGQYLMFETLAKTLGIYDESLPIFQLDYKDMLYAPIWDDKTADVELGYAPDVELNTEADKTQMNGSMPEAPNGSSLLSYIDFTDANGYFDGTGTHTIDLTTGDGALTFQEAQGLGKSFSVVFRAKLGFGAQPNAGLFMLSGDGLDSWNHALTFGVPSKNHELWYRIRQNGVDMNSVGGRLALDGMNVANDGQWHTIAFTVSESTLNYYVDGVLVDTMVLTESIDLGSLFTSENAYAARFGRYSNNDATTYSTLKGNFDFWQFYSGELTAAQVKALAGEDTAGVQASQWLQAYTENNLWAVAGADQMSGYQGLYVNRSLFHLLEGTIRATGNQPQHYRDLRLMNISAPGYTVSDMAEQLAKMDFEVLLLLPEVSQVFAENYEHSADLVAEYKASVKALLAQYTDKVRILWTPLASADSVINGYLSDYAAAIREIAAEDSTILFWDANAFMNQNMTKNPALVDNWFDGEMYITPLAANDLCRGFFTTIQTNGVSLMTLNELADHNLRQTSDVRYFKNEIMRDNIAAGVTVDGTTISLDLSAMVEAGYDLTDVQFHVIPSVGYGMFNDAVHTVTGVTVEGNVYSFEAPCSYPVIMIIADDHRFQDLEVEVTTSATLPETVIPPATDLTGLKVLGAKDFGFQADTTSYKVNLYQYQSHVVIVGTAAYGQTITVNGEEVLSGERSSLIKVEDGSTITVKANGKTYTLTMVRPEYPDIIVTEVMQSTNGEQYDMLEIYNASGKDLDLKDYSIGFKKDYSGSKVNVSNNQWPYYFLGNDTSFHAAKGGSSKTGINAFTKYSTYEPGYDAAKEPESIPFPADSTMVVWVRRGWTDGLTYEDLIQNLTDKADGSNYDNKTLSINGTPVVPGVDQLVVAEVPKGAPTGGQSSYTTYPNGYLEDHTTLDNVDADMNARTWLFILDKDAQQHYFNGVTAAGDDIYSAAMLSRVSTSMNLSSVLYYNVERGMSVMREPGNVLAAPVTGYTSDKSDYMNLTTFGAIEYWQKPLDLSDTEAPVVIDNSGDGKIELTLKDNMDVRYMQLHIDEDGDGIYETTVVRDWVLESSAKSATGTTEVAKERTVSQELGKSGKYYGYVVDGNNNVTNIGNASQLEISLEGSEEDVAVDVQIKLHDGLAIANLDSDLSIVDEQGNVVGKLSVRTLKANVTLKSGQSVCIVGVPKDAGYTVTVTTPEGYEQMSAVSGTVQMGAAAAVKLVLTEVKVEETTEPETTEPETTEGEETTEVTEPETTGPAVTEPAETQPEASEPEASVPETTKPASGSQTTQPAETTAPAESTPSGGQGDNSESPATGNEVLQQIIVSLIVVVSAATIAVMAVIGVKYKKIAE